MNKKIIKFLPLVIVFIVILSIFAYKKCSDVKITSLSDGEIRKEFKKYNNSCEIDGDEYGSWFLFTPQEFIDRVNEKAVEKGYKELVDLEGDNKLYSNNGETWNICIDSQDCEGLDGYGYVQKIELTLYTDSRDESRMNGDYMYIIIDVLNEGMQKKVCDELNVFKQPKTKIPNWRYVTCGNVEYLFEYSEHGEGSFIAKPIKFTPEKSKGRAPAIKPAR